MPHSLKPVLSIIIPTLNEAKNLPELLADAGRRAPAETGVVPVGQRAG